MGSKWRAMSEAEKHPFKVDAQRTNRQLRRRMSSANPEQLLVRHEMWIQRCPAAPFNANEDAVTANTQPSPQPSLVLVHYLGDDAFQMLTIPPKPILVVSQPVPTPADARGTNLLSTDCAIGSMQLQLLCLPDVVAPAESADGEEMQDVGLCDGGEQYDEGGEDRSPALQPSSHPCSDQNNDGPTAVALGGPSPVLARVVTAASVKPSDGVVLREGRAALLAHQEAEVQSAQHSLEALLQYATPVVGGPETRALGGANAAELQPALGCAHRSPSLVQSSWRLFTSCTHASGRAPYGCEAAFGYDSPENDESEQFARNVFLCI